jgi:hypothetical protein
VKRELLLLASAVILIAGAASATTITVDPNGEGAASVVQGSTITGGDTRSGGAASDRLVSLSGAAPGSYITRGDADSVVIPFEFYGMNLMVEASIRGWPVTMSIDNGVLWDELWFYGSALTDSLGIPREEAAYVDGAGEGSGLDSYTASGVSITFGDVSFSDQPAIITPEEQGIAALFPGVDGQVSGAFFKHFIVGLDFDRQVVVLHEPANYHYDGAGVSVEMTRDPSESYSIPVTLGLVGGRSVDTSLFIDLGGVYALSLVVDEAAGIDRPDSEKVLLGYGASGEINGYRGRIESLTVGPYTLTDVVAVFTEPPGGADFTNATIGLPALRRFNLVFDYFQGRLYLEPNTHFGEPSEE